MKIGVWDDVTQFAIDWKAKIDRTLNDSTVIVEAHDNEQISVELRRLHEQRKAYLRTGTEPVLHEAGMLDEIDILIVDNDLFELEDFSDYSAEMVAARAQVYSKCGYVVVLNLNPDVDFDLSLLGNPTSKADLHINDKFVADIGLWRDSPKAQGAFRPWHWPLLKRASELHKLRVNELQEFLNGNNKEMPVLEYFSFDETASNRLSRSARAFLHPSKNTANVTFFDFVEGNANAVDLKDGRKIIEKGDADKVAQICAHRIAKWLARLVLGPQDILIDLPHLAEKLPFLVPQNRQTSLDFWNSCATQTAAPTSELTEDISAYRFEHEHWFDRPVYWWDKFDPEQTLDKLLAMPNSNPGELVFCEDSSAFHNSNQCQRFVAAHHSTTDNRYIRWFNEDDVDFSYGPQSRLAI